MGSLGRVKQQLLTVGNKIGQPTTRTVGCLPSRYIVHLKPFTSNGLDGSPLQSHHLKSWGVVSLLLQQVLHTVVAAGALLSTVYLQSHFSWHTFADLFTA